MKIKLLLLEATYLKPSKLLLPQSPHSVMISYSKRTNRFDEIRKDKRQESTSNVKVTAALLFNMYL